MSKQEAPAARNDKPKSNRYRGYAKSDLKLLEAAIEANQTMSKEGASSSNQNPASPVATTHRNGPIIPPSNSSYATNGGTFRKSPATASAWKVGVADRGNSKALKLSPAIAAIFGEDDIMAQTLMPSSSSSERLPKSPSSPTNAHANFSHASTSIESTSTHYSGDDFSDDDYEEEYIDDEEYVEKPGQDEHSAGNRSAPSSLLGPPPTAAATQPPFVPSPPPTPHWFKGENSVPDNSDSHSPPTSPRNKSSSVFRQRDRSTAVHTIRRTIAGSQEEVGLVRLSEIAGLPLPHFRKDFQVSILIQYSDSSKDTLEYKNRIHPNCLTADIINECISKTKRKIPTWSPPADKFGSFELIVPSRSDEDDEIVMDLSTPIWKFCFVPGEVTRLVLRPKIRVPGERIALKVRMDRGPMRTMMFYTISPIEMVIQRIQHKAKGVESRGPPFTGLYLFENKRGRFLEDKKTLADCKVSAMDIIQVKRRRLMELCLKDQPTRKLMVPLDLTAITLAGQLHDWLRLDPVDIETLMLVRVVPKRSGHEEMPLVLNANTDVRSFRFFKGDVLQLRKKVTKSAASFPTPSSRNLPSSIHSVSVSNAVLVETKSNSLSRSSANNPTKSNEPPLHHSISTSSLKMEKASTPPETSRQSGGGSSPDALGRFVAVFQVAFAGSSHDSESYGQDAPHLKGAKAVRYPPPKLKAGEVAMFQTIFGIHLWDSSTRQTMRGDLHVTNYRLFFSSFCDDTGSDYFQDVPLTTISRAEKTGDKNKPGIKLDCKDFRTLKFHFERADKDNRRQLKQILEDCLYPNFKYLFALAYKQACLAAPEPNKIDGWQLFDPQREFIRMGVGTGDKGSKWRICKLNEHYQYSKTYPALIGVPASISDEELIPVFKYRSKGRLPALSWVNSRTGASITRCSQPLTGVTKKISLDDANLINAIKDAQGSADSKLHLLDARPRANAIANMAMGGGFEVMSGSAYNGCDLEFLNIGNIHVMRTALSDLKALIEAQPYDGSFLAKIDATGWLLHISLILQGAVKIVEHIQQRHSCVLHCSDGWDRTSQLSAVAMLLLDPYYRTISGLCVLIEKEWCSFGHKFAQRYGHLAVDHVDKNYAHGERAPIFVQFIDCVYQIQRQFPCAFEFTENALLSIMEHLYSCHFGTFLFDCERERSKELLSSKTESLWTYLLDPNNARMFKNIFYEPFDSVLPLAPTLADIVLWRSYYRRWYAPPEEDQINVAIKVQELHAENIRQAQRIAELEAKLAYMSK